VKIQAGCIRDWEIHIDTFELPNGLLRIQLNIVNKALNNELIILKQDEITTNNWN
jgi:hypothetical protein